MLAAVDDDYFRERAADVRDVGRRVAAILTGGERPDLWHPDGTPAVLVAADLDPSAVATLRPELVAGIALAGGAPTGHAAIVARALGIPLVLGLGSALTAVVEDVAGVDGAVDGSDGPAADRADRRGRARARTRAGGGFGVGFGGVSEHVEHGGVGHQRRVDRGERGLGARGGGGGPGRRRGDRPRPDRAPVPWPVDAAVGRRAAFDLRPHPRGHGRSAGRLPDARRRR